jgi:CubicO group peptidase (beta-lactamase class C family)
MSARRILIALLAGLLCACGGGGGGGYGSSAPPAPAPPTGSPQPPPPVTIIDIAQPWATATAAEVNMDEVMLGRAASDAAAMPRFRSLLVARHGKLVAENYFSGADRATVFDLRSVTKSVVSMLTGIAIQNGSLPNIDATVGAYVDTPYSLDTSDRAVSVRQLLTMSSRYQWNENSADDYNLWVLSNDHVQFLLDRRQSDPAGTFTYNSAAVNLLGVVLQDAVAKPLPAFAEEVLFQPVGITSVQWEQLEPNMVNAGSGIKMTATDLLRIGQLLLQRGRSGSRQVVPEAWIDAGTTPQFGWREQYGAQRGTTYGYLWWVAQPPATVATFAWGFGGQFAYVVPSLDLVVVATTQWQGISAEVNPTTFAGNVLTVIVNDILPAAR